MVRVYEVVYVRMRLHADGSVKLMWKSNVGSWLTHDDTHFVETFVVQIVHWLAVDIFLLAATLETAAVVHRC